MRFSSAWLVLATALAGCSVAREILPPAAEPSPAAHDCRENTSLFRYFTVHATTVTWSGTRRRSPRRDQLTIELEFANTDDLPHALSNSGGGLLYDVNATLTGADGAQHEAAAVTGALKAPGLHAPINPTGITQGGLVFRVPRGPYTLTLAREAPSQPIGADRGHLVARCLVAG